MFIWAPAGGTTGASGLLFYNIVKIKASPDTGIPYTVTIKGSGLQWGVQWQRLQLSHLKGHVITTSRMQLFGASGTKKRCEICGPSKDTKTQTTCRNWKKHICGKHTVVHMCCKQTRLFLFPPGTTHQLFAFIRLKFQLMYWEFESKTINVNDNIVSLHF